VYRHCPIAEMKFLGVIASSDVDCPVEVSILFHYSQPIDMHTQDNPAYACTYILHMLVELVAGSCIGYVCVLISDVAVSNLLYCNG